MLNIKKLRGKLGLSQQELADKIGVSRASMNWWESPECVSLTPRIQVAMCDIFKCDPIDLYGADNFRVKPHTNEERRRMIKYIESEMTDEEED